MEYYVYVLFSSKFNQIYIGYSSDVDARFLSHNKLATKGWTIRYRPWMLVHKENGSAKLFSISYELVGLISVKNTKNHLPDA